MDSTIGFPPAAPAPETHSDRVSEAVVTAVATAKGVDPLDLEPLYSVVDPDALDAMFRQTAGAASTLELTFTMAGCEVVVAGADDVAVTPPADSDNPTTVVPKTE